MSYHKTAKPSTTSISPQPPAYTLQNSRQTKQWPRFLRFLNAFKTVLPDSGEIMSWKVEGEEWVK